MIYKETNLTKLFKELAIHSDYSQLDDNNITMACYSAINEMEDKHCISDVIFKMSMALQTITRVVNELASKTKKADKARMRTCDSDNMDYCTVCDLLKLHTNISGEAIRKACKEGRLNFKQGKGKNKYLIKKSDFDTYIMSAKGKNQKNFSTHLSTAA